MPTKRNKNSNEKLKVEQNILPNFGEYQKIKQRG